MGFLDKLRGGGGTTVNISVDRVEVAPGDQVTVHFDVAGELDPKAQGVRVALTGSANYKANVTRSQGSENDSYVSTTEEWQSYSLHNEEQGFPAKLGPGQATFTVPPDAPPSSSGAVTWGASVRIDRARGMDKVERCELSVRHGAEGIPGERSPQQSDDGLTLDDVPVAVRAGTPLTGHLTVNVPKDVNVTAVRIRLHRKVTYTAAPMNDGSIYGDGDLAAYAYGGSGQITSNEQRAEVDLAGKREFTAGTIERLPFSVDVPPTAGPTTAHRYARVEWRLEAVLDRRMRGDLSVETPLIVY